MVVNGPFFEHPTLKFSPRADQITIDIDDKELINTRGDVRGSTPPPNKTWTALTKLITSKFGSNFPIRELA